MIRLDVKHFFLIKLNVRTESGILIFIPLLFICHYQMSLTFVISSLWFVLVSLCSCFFSTLSPHTSANRSRWLAGSTGGLFLLKGVFSFLLLPSVAHRVSFLFWHFKTIVHSDWRWDLLALTHLIPNSTLCQCVLLIMFKKKKMHNHCASALQKTRKSTELLLFKYHRCCFVYWLMYLQIWSCRSTANLTAVTARVSALCTSHLLCCSWNISTAKTLWKWCSMGKTNAWLAFF